MLTITRSAELTSKKEGNCNVMVTGPTDHESHVILLSATFAKLHQSNLLIHFFHRFFIYIVKNPALAIFHLLGLDPTHLPLIGPTMAAIH